MAALAELVAHGNNLDELGLAALALVGVAVVGALAWIGGRRDREEYEKEAVSRPSKAKTTSGEPRSGSSNGQD